MKWPEKLVIKKALNIKYFNRTLITDLKIVDNNKMNLSIYSPSLINKQAIILNFEAFFIPIYQLTKMIFFSSGNYVKKRFTHKHCNFLSDSSGLTL